MLTYDHSLQETERRGVKCVQSRAALARNVFTANSWLSDRIARRWNKVGTHTHTHARAHTQIYAYTHTLAHTNQPDARQGGGDNCGVE